MKRFAFLLCVLSLLLAMPALAETVSTLNIDGGSVYVSGQSESFLEILRRTIDGGDANQNSTEFTVSVRGGYFVIDGLCVGSGVLLGYRASTYEVDGGADTDFTTFRLGLAPFGRYYFEIGRSFAPFVGGDLGLYYSTSANGADYSETIFGFNVDGGIALFFADNWSLDAFARTGYSFGSQDVEYEHGGDDSVSIGEFGIKIGIAVSAYF